MQVIRFLSVSESMDPIADQIEKTYNDSFPWIERRDFDKVRTLIDAHKAFSAYALLKEDVYIGFITSWDFDAFRYVEHFAIDKTARNGGEGSKALRHFLGQSDKPVVLEVELPEDELSRRRIRFYERLHFKCHDFEYYQPSYHSADDNLLEMRLMTWGDIGIPSPLLAWSRIIHREVYGIGGLE